MALTVRTVETWEQAYGQCREQDRPLAVHVLETSETGTVFPSGHYRPDKYRNTPIGIGQEGE